MKIFISLTFIITLSLGCEDEEYVYMPCGSNSAIKVGVRCADGFYSEDTSGNECTHEHGGIEEYIYLQYHHRSQAICNDGTKIHGQSENICDNNGGIKEWYCTKRLSSSSRGTGGF